MNFGSRRSKRINDLNLTPLIDIVFQLLIFFLITTNFVETPGFEVDLPRANAADPMQDNDQTSIAVDAEGQIYFQGRQMSASELALELQQIQRSQPLQTLAIFADTLAPHGRVTAVMDAAKDAGITKLVVATGE